MTKLGATSCCNARSTPGCMPIEIPSNDNFYSNFRVTCLPLTRNMAGVRLDCVPGYADQVK